MNVVYALGFRATPKSIMFREILCEGSPMMLLWLPLVRLTSVDVGKLGSFAFGLPSGLSTCVFLLEKL